MNQAQPQSPKNPDLVECERAADEVIKAGIEFHLSKSGKHKLSKSGKVIRSPELQKRLDEDERERKKA